ncbi:MAG: phosphate-starvation-inducible PsiE family protein [Rhodomicrobium sp.]
MNAFKKTREAWPVLDLYQRFEQIVAIVLSVVISIVIIFAIWGLVIQVVRLAFQGLIDPANPLSFRVIFSMIITVLIALEFNHTIPGLFERGRSVVQARTVVLIALLAILRKFIVLEITEVSPLLIFGLAACVIALGAVYWAIREQDQSLDKRKELPGESGEPRS